MFIFFQDKHPNATDYVLRTSFEHPPGVHDHHFYLTHEQMVTLEKGRTVAATTTIDAGHKHDLVLRRKYGANLLWLEVITCDGGDGECWDKHTFGAHLFWS